MRRVVTGRDDLGRQVVLSDGTPPHTTEAPTGQAVSTLLWLDAPAVTAADGGDPPPGGWSLEPPVGGVCSRIVRLVPQAAGDGADGWLRVPGEDPARPGMHVTDTLDLMVVIDGQIELGLDDGTSRLGPRDAVIQRGTLHRWRVIGDEPCTFFVTMLRRDAPGASAVPLTPRPAGAPAGTGLRRLVTTTGAKGSALALDGEPPVVVAPDGPSGRMMVDLWQTGGRVTACDQGGDTDQWELDPVGGGVAFRLAQLLPGRDPGSRGWHVTSSIDVDLILAGRIQLSVPDSPPVVLETGDVVIQRGTDHLWTPLGDEPALMAAVMIGVERLQP